MAGGDAMLGVNLCRSVKRIKSLKFGEILIELRP